MKRLAVLIVIALSLTGCGDNALVSKAGGSVEEQTAELLRRPSIEAASARYEEMSGRLRAELAAAFPWMQWKKTLETNRAACSDYEAFNDIAESWTLGVWVADGTVPDAEWPRAEQIFARVLGEYGFARPKPLVNRPNDHQMTSTDRYGATFTFGTAKRTTFSPNTGCHLPQSEKDRHPQPQQQDG